MKETVAQRFLLAFLLIFASASARAQSVKHVGGGGTKEVTTQAELDSLSRNGPVILSDHAGDEIRIRGLFKWDWSVNIVYELTRPGTVTLTIAVDGHEQLVSLTFPPQSVNAIHMLTAMMQHNCLKDLPGGIVGATYSIKAVSDMPSTSGEPLLTIRAIAAGPLGDERGALDDDLLAPPAGFPSLRGARLTDAAYGFAPQSYKTAVPLGLRELSFTPPRIPVVEGRPSERAAYSFRVTFPFNSARAEIKRYDDKDSMWRSVNVQEFGPGLTAGKVLNGAWDCMNGGSPSLGKHKLWVTAWFTIDRGGKWSHVTSELVSIL